MSLNNSIIEDVVLEWFGELGYDVGHGPQLALSEPAAAREVSREQFSEPLDLSLFVLSPVWLMSFNLPNF